MIGRRGFIVLLGGAVVAWPLAVRAQRSERMRRIGVLMNLAAEDPESQARIGALLQGLQEFGWAIGRNAQIDIRWGMGDAERSRKHATELVALTPDVVFATTFPTVAALQQATRAVPIVFAGVIDPVGAGLVASLARPGGNTTGFAGFEYGRSAKWLELLKQVAPRLTRVAVLRDSLTPVGIGQLAAIQGVASSFGVELSPLVVRDVGEMESAVAAFARSSNDGLIVTIGTLTDAHRELISALATRHRLPAVYPFPFFVRRGGLISYGPDIVDSFRRAAGYAARYRLPAIYPFSIITDDAGGLMAYDVNITDLFRRAATYVDNILKGAKPSDLPVQQPTKFEFIINLKTAKTLGLTFPPSLLAIADEVIE